MTIYDRNARLAGESRSATLSMPHLYCARCGHSLKYRVAERGDWFGIEPTMMRCPRCGALLLGDATIEVLPRNTR